MMDRRTLIGGGSAAAALLSTRPGYARAAAVDVVVFGDSYSQVPRAGFPNWVTQLQLRTQSVHPTISPRAALRPPISAPTTWPANFDCGAKPVGRLATGSLSSSVPMTSCRPIRSLPASRPSTRPSRTQGRRRTSPADRTAECRQDTSLCRRSGLGRGHEEDQRVGQVSAEPRPAGGQAVRRVCAVAAECCAVPRRSASHRERSWLCRERRAAEPHPMRRPAPHDCGEPNLS